MAKVKIISPIGVAVYPHLTKPDNYKNNVRYKVKLRLDPKDAKATTARIDAMVKEHWPKLKNPKVPYYKDDEGNIIVSYKSKFQPTLFDAKNRKLVDGFDLPPQSEIDKHAVGSGSILRIAAEPYFYDEGMSFQLKSVQIIKLVKYTGSSDFDEAEGYDSEEGDSESDFAPDNTDETAGDGEGEEELDL